MPKDSEQTVEAPEPQVTAEPQVETPQAEETQGPTTEWQGTSPEELEQQAEEAGEQEAAEEPAGEEPPAAEEGAWRQDPDLLDYAASAGIPPEELEDYGDQYELERAVRLADRRRYADLSQQQPVQQQPVAPEPVQEPPQAPTGLPALDRDQLDEPVVKAIEADRTHYQAQFDGLSRQFGEAIDHFNRQASAMEFQQVQHLMDGLGLDDLFGKSEKVAAGSEQARNRARVVNAFAYLEPRFQANYSGPTKAMVQRAVNQEFWSELKKEETRQFRRKLGKQGKRVLPGKRRKTATETSEDPEGGGISDQSERELVQQHRKMTG